MSHFFLKAQRHLKKARSRLVPQRRDDYYSSRAFIESQAYAQMMLKYYGDRDGPMSAEHETKNFYYRHHVMNDILGAWRWLGLYENRELLGRYVFDPSKRGLDFGGARGPISAFVDVCDRLDRDLFGRETKYHRIEETEDDSFDYIWSSHTLEHLDDVEHTMRGFKRKLREDGHLFLHVPSYTCARWRASVHSYADAKGDSSHRHTFCLAVHKESAKGLDSLIEIDALAQKQFEMESAVMCGDNSIFLVLRG